MAKPIKLLIDVIKHPKTKELLVAAGKAAAKVLIDGVGKAKK